jgi:hypothetical protein
MSTSIFMHSNCCMSICTSACNILHKASSLCGIAHKSMYLCSLLYLVYSYVSVRRVPRRCLGTVAVVHDAFDAMFVCVSTVVSVFRYFDRRIHTHIHT